MLVRKRLLSRADWEVRTFIKPITQEISKYARAENVGTSHTDEKTGNTISILDIEVALQDTGPKLETLCKQEGVEQGGESSPAVIPTQTLYEILVEMSLWVCQNGKS